MQLAKLFEFAERLFIHQLKNYVIYQLFDLRSENHIPPIPVIEFAFERLSLESPFLRLLVAWYIWHRDSALALTVDSLDALPQFSSALVVAMVKQRHAGSQDPFSGKPDVYYESNDEPPNETSPAQILDLNSCQEEDSPTQGRPTLRELQ